MLLSKCFNSEPFFGSNHYFAEVDSHPPRASISTVFESSETKQGPRLKHIDSQPHCHFISFYVSFSSINNLCRNKIVPLWRKWAPVSNSALQVIPSTSTTTTGYTTGPSPVATISWFGFLLQIELWCLPLHFWQQRGNLFAHAPRKGTVNKENRWYAPPKCKEEMKQMAIFARNIPGITVFFFSFCAL